MNQRVRSFCVVNLVCLLLGLAYGTTAAQQPFDVKANYTKREVQIPMRDGVKLFTSIYVPKPSPLPPSPNGRGDGGEGVKYPIMLLRTPYSVGPYGADYRGGLGPSLKFAQEGYIFAYQDVRGRWMSEGEFVDVRPHKPVKSTPQDIDENSDTYDTIEWLLKNTPNNGRVGMWGVSYPGFYTSMGLMDTHPALKAASPQAPVSEWFIGDDWHHQGALMLTDAFGFYSIIGQPRPTPTTQGPPRFDFKMPDQYKFFLEMGPLRNANEKYFNRKLVFWNHLMEHPNYDQFWKARTPLPHLKNVKCAVMTVGGWFDAEDLYGALKTYQAVERQNPGIHNTLVMGPWTHGGWSGGDGAGLADISFGDKTAPWYRDNVEFPFFNYYLKDKGTLDQPEALAFETGSNTWQKFDAWPPRNLKAKSIYFAGGGKLSFEPRKPESTSDFDEYVSDPAKPVPYTPAIQSSARHVNDYMIEDQRFAATRPDVLVYRSEVLNEDMKIAGPVTATLFISTTGTDADFVVKVIDVFPDDTPDNNPNPRNVRMGGYQMLVRVEVMRARFRDSYEKPRPLRPGRVTPIKFALPDVCHAFKKGHRLMVQVQSSWFPLIDRNPQKFVDIYSATEADFQKATHRVYFSAKYPSRIEVGVRE